MKDPVKKIWYHGYVAGYSKEARSMEEMQQWLDGIRKWVVGDELTIYRVVGCLYDQKPIIRGAVSA